MPSRNPVIKERSKSALAVAGWSYLGYRYKKLAFRLKKPRAQNLTNSGQTLYREESYSADTFATPEPLSFFSEPPTPQCQQHRSIWSPRAGGFSWYNHPISCLNCTNNEVSMINPFLYLETAHPNRHREAIIAKETLITYRHFC